MIRYHAGALTAVSLFIMALIPPGSAAAEPRANIAAGENPYAPEAHTATAEGVRASAIAHGGPRAAPLADTSGAATPRPFDDAGSKPLLTMISAWISYRFDLPPPAVLPHIAFVPAHQLAHLRYELSGVPIGDRSRIGLADDHLGTAAFYDRTAATIYLPDTWTAGTLTELSILVHEMAHHIDVLAGRNQGDPAAGERFAYLVQDRWLNLFGENLESAFGLDLFSVLMRTAWTY